MLQLSQYGWLGQPVHPNANQHTHSDEPSPDGDTHLSTADGDGDLSPNGGADTNGYCFGHADDTTEPYGDRHTVAVFHAISNGDVYANANAGHDANPDASAERDTYAGGCP